MTKKEILIATKNAGKIKELGLLLAVLPISLRGLNDFPKIIEPAETGSDFASNAALKAKSYALQTGLWALADDSGLEVEALNGAPGVFSARYGGANAGDAEKIKKLLDELDKMPPDAAPGRAARFVCVMAIADPTGEIKYLAEGICHGKIAGSPRGTNGFGYDPIFIPEGFEETFGELSNQIKRLISHRARASEKIIEYLRGFTAA